MNDKEKIQESKRQIDEILEAVSERKKIWEYVLHVSGNQVNLFLDPLIRDLGKMKKTLEE